MERQKLSNEISSKERDELFKGGCIICKNCFHVLSYDDFMYREVLGYDDSGHCDYIDNYKCNQCGVTDYTEDLYKYNDNVYFIKGDNVYYYDNSTDRIMKYNKNTLLGSILYNNIQLIKLVK